jgi:hypothetical protein
MAEFRTGIGAFGERTSALFHAASDSVKNVSKATLLKTGLGLAAVTIGTLATAGCGGPPAPTGPTLPDTAPPGTPIITNSQQVDNYIPASQTLSVNGGTVSLRADLQSRIAACESSNNPAGVNVHAASGANFNESLLGSNIDLSTVARNTVIPDLQKVSVANTVANRDNCISGVLQDDQAKLQSTLSALTTTTLTADQTQAYNVMLASVQSGALGQDAANQAQVASSALGDAASKVAATVDGSAAAAQFRSDAAALNKQGATYTGEAATYQDEANTATNWAGNYLAQAKLYNAVAADANAATTLDYQAGCLYTWASEGGGAVAAEPSSYCSVGGYPSDTSPAGLNSYANNVLYQIPGAYQKTDRDIGTANSTAGALGLAQMPSGSGEAYNNLLGNFIQTYGYDYGYANGQLTPARAAWFNNNVVAPIVADSGGDRTNAADLSTQAGNKEASWKATAATDQTNANQDTATAQGYYDQAGAKLSAITGAEQTGLNAIEGQTDGMVS